MWREGEGTGRVVGTREDSCAATDAGLPSVSKSLKAFLISSSGLRSEYFFVTADRVVYSSVQRVRAERSAGAVNSGRQPTCRVRWHAGRWRRARGHPQDAAWEAS